jgi:hypothetical protein
MIRLVAPGIYGNQIFGNTYWGPFTYTETNFYIGILPLVLVAVSLFSPKRKLAIGLFVLGLLPLLAVYNIFPFRQIIAFIYPLFLNTFPGRIFYVTAFTWSLASGLGADWLVRERPTRFLKILSIVILGPSIILLSLFCVSRYVQQESPDLAFVSIGYQEKIARIDSDSLLVASGLLALSALLLWLLRRTQKNFWAMAIPSLALMIIIGDLFTHGINYNPSFAPYRLPPPPPSLETLQDVSKSERTPYRILTVNSNSILPGLTPELYALPTVTGYSSWVLQRYSRYADLTQNRYQASLNHVYFDDCCPPMLDALNIKYVYSSPDSPPSSSGVLSLVNVLDNAIIETEQPDFIGKNEWTIDGITRPILFQHPPSRIVFPLNLSRSTIFKTAISLDPEAWAISRDGVVFEVLIAEKNSPDTQVLFSNYLNPRDNPEDRSWIPLEIDLSQYVGKDISLILQTSPGPGDDSSFDWAGWASPHIENYSPATLELIYDGPNKIFRNPEAFPRAWLVDKIHQVPKGDLEAVEALLKEDGFDLSAEAVIEGELNNPLGETHPTDGVDVVLYTPEQVEILVENAENAFLVFSDVMYPGWKVFIDGIEQPIFSTNLIMRGVYLEAGVHQVVFKFRPTSFYLGLGIAVLALTIFLLGFVFSSIRSRQKAIE